MKMAERVPILYRDESIVAVDKPSGLLVHRSGIDRGESSYALQTVREMTGRFLYPLHRLDKPTSGVLLFAFDKRSARLLSERFAAREVQKRYIAVVRGYTEADGVVDYPLKEISDGAADTGGRIVRGAKEAVTLYRRLATVELPIAVSRYPKARYSLVELLPLSGRTHQLRRHMKHIFHPIVGDTKYGRSEHNRLFRYHFGIHRLLLHAASLSFVHPVHGYRLTIEAPLPAEFLLPFVHRRGEECPIGPN